MATCHEARKGRNAGSRGSKPVADSGILDHLHTTMKNILICLFSGLLAGFPFNAAPADAPELKYGLYIHYGMDTFLHAGEGTAASGAIRARHCECDGMGADRQGSRHDVRSVDCET